MTSRACYLLGTGLLLLVTALTIGSFGLLAAAVCVITVFAVSLVSDIFALITLCVRADTETVFVKRGDARDISIRSRHLSPVPPGEIEYLFMDGIKINLSCVPFQMKTVRTGVTFRHRGVYNPGEGRAYVTDIFGLFTLSKRIDARAGIITALPKDDARFTADECDTETGMAKARIQDDKHEPASVREWRDGDSLKSIHWKLTLKNPLSYDGSFNPIVKTYDEAVRPDILILPDFSVISAAGERGLDVEDAICDAALSAMKSFAAVNDATRLITPRGEFDMYTASEALARAAFDEPDAYEWATDEVMRRSARTGAAVFVTSRLSFRSADTLIKLSRSAMAQIFLIWVTDTRVRDAGRLSARLEAGGVRVTLINPFE